LAILSLRAPIAVPVEIRAPARRVFRLAANVGEDGVRLPRSPSFEPGRPVDVRFALPPDGASGAVPLVLALRAVIAPGRAEDDALEFVAPPAESRAALRRYVHDRLGLA